MGNPLAKYHPLTNALIVPLGYLPNGRAIWPIMGGDDTVTPAAGPQGDPAPTGTPPPADQPPADSTPDGDEPLGEGGKRALQAERDARKALEKQVNDLQTAQQQQFDAIAKALGLKPDDTPPDPQALAAQVSTEQEKAREAAVQLAVYRNATTAGGNPDALLDSASFLASVKGLDPNDATAVTDAIKTAVAANSRLAAAPDFPAAGQAGIGVGGSATPLDPRLADYAQIERDIAASKSR